jgi:hypothetical protein
LEIINSGIYKNKVLSFYREAIGAKEFLFSTAGCGAKRDFFIPINL